MIRVRLWLVPAVVLVAACGQRGDLYLPQQREAVATVPTGAATGTAPQDEEEDAQTVQPPATDPGAAPTAPANND